MFKELSGPAVVMLDDIEKEILSIQAVLKIKEIDCEFIKLDITGDSSGLREIPNVRLIFLDLHYDNRFDSELCVEYISRILPEEKQYYLVIWTKDPDRGSEVIEKLKQYNLMPVDHVIKHKHKYWEKDSEFNANKLLDEIERDFQQATDIQRFYGQVINIEEDHVLINCLVEEEPPVFQVRRFDRELFRDYIEIAKQIYLSIVITTKPGSRVFEFYNEPTSLAEKFTRPDYFQDLGDISFLDDEQ